MAVANAVASVAVAGWLWRGVAVAEAVASVAVAGVAAGVAGVAAAVAGAGVTVGGWSWRGWSWRGCSFIQRLIRSGQLATCGLNRLPCG